MPHGQRRRSKTGYYHVVAKGDGGQLLFESDDGRVRFLAELENAANDNRIQVHAYCLMSNHVHLVVEDREANLSAFMKQVCERYAMYFGWMTGRVGHVFQGRFWSEPIECDEYMLAAVRYVHANPEPAGICRARDYKWSSYGSYVGNKASFVKTETVLGIFGSKSAFERFHDNGGRYAKPFPESALTKHLTYEELLRIAIEVLGRETLNELKSKRPNERQDSLEALSKAGLRDNEIARLTGIGQTSVRRALLGYLGSDPK